MATLREMIATGKVPLYEDEYWWLLDHKFEIENTASKKHAEKFLIATKRTKGGEIEIYGQFYPAHFFEIRATDEKGGYVVFSTGSGSLARHLKKLMPVISEFLENMIVVEKVGKVSI